MRFLVDAQLPPALARYLTEAGHEAVHVADLDMERAPDADIWRTAIERNQVIVTKDEDFVALRTARLNGPPVVWLRIGNTTRETLLRIVSASLPGIVSALEEGEVLVEVIE